MPFRSLLLVFAVFTLIACQQAAWKQGGTAEDLKRDEQACQAKVPAGDDELVKQCLRGKGWTVTDFRTAPTEDETESAAAEAPPSPTAPALSNKTSDINTSPTPDKSTSNAPVPPPATSAAPATPTSSAAPAAVKRQPKDPMQRQSIQTWWKAGAQAADFKTDESACLDQLGEQHRPDYVQHLYTRALMSCLQTHGWHAGYDPVYTPLR
ncbi:MAG TPA: hypothetical protein VGK97_08085 [Spongiibacteraceae bacterium]|jgi:hypothetical protein